MYLLLPLILILASCLGIAIIVYRKVPYLKKLTPESHEFGSSVFHDFFPELMTWLEQFAAQGYKQRSLVELEKTLRRFRLLSLKIDHMADSLIKKVRRIHVSAALENKVTEEKFKEETVSLEPRHKTMEEVLQELKTQEQNLIIEIAKNPKNPQLYEALGDLYLKLNSPEEAKESFEAALELNPHDLSLAKKYSRLLHKTEAVA